MKRTRGQKKDRSVGIHFRRRCSDRLGIYVSAAEVQAIAADIQAGRTQALERQSNTRTVHRVTLRDQTIRVVYDRARKAPVTVLPEPFPDLTSPKESRP